jgi:ergothioneine biosynthesis protein EgtB
MVEKSQLVSDEIALPALYSSVRQHSLQICESLEAEDFSCQPELYVSPPKWHLAHTTWFFEKFVLEKVLKNYQPYDPSFAYLFNSYYETAGDHLPRNKRGALTRPTIDAIREYRRYVDEQMETMERGWMDDDVRQLIITGLNHEQQHQELLLMDIKFILGTNPLYPSCLAGLCLNEMSAVPQRLPSITIDEGIYLIGHGTKEFAFDNESPRHRVHLDAFGLESDLVTNGEYLDFILDNGYKRVDLWLSDGWQWVNESRIRAPLYWHFVDGIWCCYDFDGLRPVDVNLPVMHVSQYEANAFARWKGMRLPTEFEWEAASPFIEWGTAWEHTASAYLPYPGYQRPEGTIGEYNAKFMSNQMVLRGASIATPPGHQRLTYRNFFTPDMRWQFSGIRLAKTL